jgi:hypothetical protein
MSVRPDVAWYWRILSVLAAAVSLVAAVWFIGGALGVFDGLRRGAPAAVLPRAEGEPQTRELAELHARVAQGERQLQMERAATAELGKQVKALSFENAALKEDLAFFQSLMSNAAAREAGISVNRFRLVPDAVAGEFRYQMLLVQSGQRVKEFQGRIQFVLDVQQDGRKLVVVMPPEAERETRDYQLNFKFFQRIEGTFKLNPGSVLKGLQVRVFENGGRAPKLTQSLDVS